MLGSGFPPETIVHGIDLGADAIVIDGGSTDSGPYYLGTDTAKTSQAAVRRDLHVLLTAARAAGIPLIVSSCGTSGADSGVDWIADITTSIAEQEHLSFRLAMIYSEQNVDVLLSALDAGRITPLAPSGPLAADTLQSCTHVVGVLGSEPITEALRAGVQVVLTGRATDTAPLAAVALLRGLPARTAWHAAKTTECGGLCTTNPLVGVLVEVDHDGFTVESLDPSATATPTTVAAHMIHENASPFRLREPSSILDTSQAVYHALDDHRVCVEGSRFEPAEQYTVKLEGSARAGYETISLVGMRDLATWTSTLETVLTDRVRSLLGLARADYEVQVRCYGDDAILGSLEPDRTPPREVGVLLKVCAASQAVATSIAKIANPVLLHLPLPGMDYLPSFAFASSPAENERGAVYEFVLNHTVDTPHDLFRTKHNEVTYRGQL